MKVARSFIWVTERNSAPAGARYRDTEVKFVYNFLLEHIGKGNKFEIKIESLLFICENCQKYFIGLKKFAETQNIEIVYKLKANENARTIKQLNALLPNN